MRAGIKRSLPLRLLRLLTSEPAAKVLLLLLHTIEEHRFEALISARSCLLGHAAAKRIVLRHLLLLLLLLHLHLHQLLLLLHTLLRRVKIIHGLKRSILGSVGRRT